MAEEKRKTRRKRNTNSWAWSRAVARRTDFADLELQRGFRAGQFWPSLTHQQDRWSHFVSGSRHCLFTAIEKVSIKKKVLFLNTVPETSYCYTATAGLASGVCVVQGQQWLTHTLRHIPTAVFVHKMPAAAPRNLPISCHHWRGRCLSPFKPGLWLIFTLRLHVLL